MFGAPQRLGPIRRYFSSGWAFLIPYLCAYLLYWQLKWPVNPTAGPGLSPGGLHPPPLLCVYWVLHGMNLFLGGLALGSWWLDFEVMGGFGAAVSIRTKLHAVAIGLAPWALLSLLFLIPGAYLEFPSDPWEHLRRINEWSGTLSVGAHSAWLKSGYFLAYSLIGRLAPTSPWLWLDLFLTCGSLLLCWQYFLLARAVGLGRRSAFLFVLLQPLLFGNVAFSFFRYYGLAPTLLSQIAAIALVRLGVQAAFRSHAPTVNAGPGILTLLISGVFLCPFIAFNHVQGLGIAAIGLAAVAVWRLLAWRPWAAGWLVFAAVALGIATIHWLPRNPAIDQAFRPSGVLNSWYGFNLLSLDSMPADRMLQILGAFGMFNLVTGIFLVSRSHVVGWLTCMPVLALSLPFVAIPFAGALAGRANWNGIIAFHRLFLEIPQGLAVICAGKELSRSSWARASLSTPLFPSFGLLVASLTFLVTVPARGPYYNRLWHALFKVPDDLAMRGFWLESDPRPAASFPVPGPVLATTSELCFVLSAQRPTPVLFDDNRTYYNNNCIPSSDLNFIRRSLAQGVPGHSLVLLLVPPGFLYTAYSQSAILTRHWLPQEAALAYVGYGQIQRITRGGRTMATALSVDPDIPGVQWKVVEASHGWAPGPDLGPDDPVASKEP